MLCRNSLSDFETAMQVNAVAGQAQPDEVRIWQVSHGQKFYGLPTCQCSSEGWHSANRMANARWRHLPLVIDFSDVVSTDFLLNIER